jgi:hypothetical protein
MVAYQAVHDDRVVRDHQVGNPTKLHILRVKSLDFSKTYRAVHDRDTHMNVEITYGMRYHCVYHGCKKPLETNELV